MAVSGNIGEPAYFALIGDVVGSRKLEPRQRAALQRKIRKTVRHLNEELTAEVLAAYLTLTAGDEIQALFRTPDRIVHTVRYLSDNIHPVSFAFGLGYGSLSTGNIPKPPRAARNVARLDGHCFHTARDALDRAKHDGTWLVANGFGGFLDLSISATFELMGAIRRGWTEKQLGYTMAVREKSQAEVARQYGVSPSVVSESLKSASYDAVLNGEAMAEQLLMKFGSRTELFKYSALEPNMKEIRP